MEVQHSITNLLLVDDAALTDKYTLYIMIVTQKSAIYSFRRMINVNDYQLDMEMVIGAAFSLISELMSDSEVCYIFPPQDD